MDDISIEVEPPQTNGATSTAQPASACSQAGGDIPARSVISPAVARVIEWHQARAAMRANHPH